MYLGNCDSGIITMGMWMIYKLISFFYIYVHPVVYLLDFEDPLQCSVLLSLIHVPAKNLKDPFLSSVHILAITLPLQSKE